MTSPLEPFKNARLLIEAPGARGGPESGYQRSNGQQIVLDLFVKQVTEKYRSEFDRVHTASVASDYLEGYIVSYADLPTGADWSGYELSTGSQDVTGKRPPELYKGAKAVSIKFGSRTTEIVEVIEASGVYDDLGIGKVVRDVIGDRLVMKIEWRK